LSRQLPEVLLSLQTDHRSKRKRDYRFITLGREEYDAYLKHAAKEKRDMHQALVHSALEGTNKLFPEQFYQITYGMAEKRAYAGQLVAKEDSQDNDCLLIKSGTCVVNKSKNKVLMFQTWMHSLDHDTR